MYLFDIRPHYGRAKDCTLRGKDMSSWREDVIQALTNLGGVASLTNIYKEVEKIRKGNLPKSSHAITRRTIETNSSDSQVFGGNDIFYSTIGIGNGIWGLRDLSHSTPQASDISEPKEPQRTKTEVYRVLRDTALARDLKLLHKNRCQICGTTLKLKDGDYSEAHHIRPLGSPHNGSDTANNIIILCPNCHVLCDYGAIRLQLDKLQVLPEHQIGDESVSYHNAKIYGA